MHKAEIINFVKLLNQKLLNGDIEPCYKYNPEPVLGYSTNKMYWDKTKPHRPDKLSQQTILYTQHN